MRRLWRPCASLANPSPRDPHRLYDDIARKVSDGSYAPSNRFVVGAPASTGECVGALGSWSGWPVYLWLIVACVIIRVIGLYTC
jgi:hypothetical protein